MEAYRIFNNYVKNFDLKQKLIMYKFHHTYRVVNYCKAIAETEHFNKKDTNIAILCGLFHDIARFEQYQIYQTYNDAKSFDHGDRGYEILKDMINQITEDIDEQEIILFAVKYHNKKEVPKTDSRKMLFTNLVRDADKLDILKEIPTPIRTNEPFHEALFQHLKNHELCNNSEVQNDLDSLLRTIAFCFDLNFAYSYQFLLNHHIIENKCNLLEIYSNDPRIPELQKNLLLYIKEREQC